MVEASAVSGRFYTDLGISQSQVSRRKWQVMIDDGGPQVVFFFGFFRSPNQGKSLR